VQVSREELPRVAASLPTHETGTMMIMSNVSSANNSLYLNGNLIDTVAVGANSGLNQIDFLQIAYRIGGTVPNNFVGKIGDIIIYNRALSAAEMTAVHNTLKTKWNIT